MYSTKCNRVRDSLKYILIVKKECYELNIRLHQYVAILFYSPKNCIKQVWCVSITIEGINQSTFKNIKKYIFSKNEQN